MNAVTPPSGYRLEQALSAWQSTRARLLADDPDLAHDEAALVELLGDADGDVQGILARLLRGAVHAAAMASSAQDMATNLRARQDRYKRRADTMRATAFAILDAIGQRRVELPDLTAAIRTGVPSVVVTDEMDLPDTYIRVTRAPDKAALLTDLKRGVEIPGAQLSNSAPTIMIKST